MRVLITILIALTVFCSQAVFCSHATATIAVRGEQRELTQSSSQQDTSIEFWVDLSGPDDPLLIANHQVRVQLTGPNPGEDVMLLSVDDTMSAAHPQWFPNTQKTVSSGGTQALGATFNLDENDSQVNDEAGLMKVNVRVMPNVTGTYKLEVLTGIDDTLFSKADGTAIFPTSVVDGTINIAVPEPSAFLLVGLVVCVAAGYRWSRSRWSWQV